VPPGSWGSSAPDDLFFSTYVDCSTDSCVAASYSGTPPPTSDVPEPGAFVLLFLALAAAGVARHLRKRSQREGANFWATRTEEAWA
jgi:hypothetical protein